MQAGASAHTHTHLSLLWLGRYLSRHEPWPPLLMQCAVGRSTGRVFLHRQGWRWSIYWLWIIVTESQWEQKCKFKCFFNTWEWSLPGTGHRKAPWALSSPPCLPACVCVDPVRSADLSQGPVNHKRLYRVVRTWLLLLLPQGSEWAIAGRGRVTSVEKETGEGIKQSLTLITFRLLPAAPATVRIAEKRRRP